MNLNPADLTIFDKLLILQRAQFLADPEGACSLINSAQPNLCKTAPIAVMASIGAGGTTTLNQEVPEGFVWVATAATFYTDVPFAVQGVLLKDGVPWYVDPGTTPGEILFRNWETAATRWQIVLINTSLVTVNLHLSISGWQLEIKTFRNIMDALAPLAYALSEHGTPEELTT